MEHFLIPLVTNALRKALSVEARLMQLVDSKLVEALNKMKTGKAAKMSLFDKVVQCLFGKIRVNEIDPFL
jgi:hypothetical protein